MYQGIFDALISGDRNASSIDKHIILPSSFTSGAHYMIQTYQDAMTMFRFAGYPDLFITFTCNPSWPEISRLFGNVRPEVYTIEFQKRGLPHAYILISLKFMIHSPCGALNPKAQCMVDMKCNKLFPKKYNPHTSVDHEGFPTYRRREDGRSIHVKGIALDNRFVVPYNHTLLSMFHARINVEKYNQSTAIKYLFKYISKENDRIVASIYETAQVGNPYRALDEIEQYYNFRYRSACEVAWRIFGFDIQHRFPPVERLSFHLPNQQCIIYSNTDDVVEILAKPRVSESMFIAWMKQNKDNELAKTLYYYEFPQYYVYHHSKRMWQIRKIGFAIGRLTHIAPSSGEFYHLRILLTKVKGPSSYDAVRTIDGFVYPMYRGACIALGLLDDDCEFVVALKEASTWASG
ncbi:hypothetical protein K1719_011256 [Acacia pycnantha]|nr:hypothetical protein K1719_011256 [Acacia pycnantha]